MADATAPEDTETTDTAAVHTLEDYWHAVWDVVEWADGRQWLVVQEPLPLTAA